MAEASSELGAFEEEGFVGGDVVEVEVVSGEEGPPFGFVVVLFAELDHGEEDAVAEGLSGHLDDEFAVAGGGFVSVEAVLSGAFEFALEVAGVDEACGAVAVGGPVFDGVFVDEELAEGVFGECAEGVGWDELGAEGGEVAEGGEEPVRGPAVEAGGVVDGGGEVAHLREGDEAVVVGGEGCVDDAGGVGDGGEPGGVDALEAGGDGAWDDEDFAFAVFVELDVSDAVVPDALGVGAFLDFVGAEGAECADPVEDGLVSFGEGDDGDGGLDGFEEGVLGGVEGAFVFFEEVSDVGVFAGALDELLGGELECAALAVFEAVKEGLEAFGGDGVAGGQAMPGR